MRLTTTPVRGAGRRPAAVARWTTPGQVNDHQQQVVRATGAPSTTHPNQRIYEMRCLPNGHRYGANGADIHLRKCPVCQGGAKGEPLTETPVRSLFDEVAVEGTAAADVA